MRLSGNLGLAAILLLLGSCAHTPEKPETPRLVSMIKLIISPGEFENQYISVAGFLSERDYRLYLSEEHLGVLDASSSVHVRIAYRESDTSGSGDAETGCEHQFLRVTGLFKRVEHEESSEFLNNHALVDVYSLGRIKDEREPGPTRVSCWYNPDANPFPHDY